MSIIKIPMMVSRITDILDKPTLTPADRFRLEIALLSAQEYLEGFIPEDYEPGASLASLETAKRRAKTLGIPEEEVEAIRQDVLSRAYRGGNQIGRVNNFISWINGRLAKAA